MKRQRGSTRFGWLVVLLVVAALVGLTVINFRYASQNPGGNDFLVHWVGTRMFLTEGVSPYSDEAALEIQTMVYGRAARPGEHELRVAYPLYSVVVFLPFALIQDFTWARAAWMTVLELGLVLLSYFSMRLIRWRPGALMLGAFFLFSVTWYHALRPLILGNAVILVALGVVATLLAMRNNLDELAGVLLALTTIKPQVVVLAVVLIVLWSLVQRRWKVVFWFFGTLLFLVGLSFLLLPDWLRQNVAEILRYPGYNPPGTPGAALASFWPAIGKRLGYALTGVLALFLLVEWAIARRLSFRMFLWTFCLTLTISQWIGVQTDPGNFIVLMPVLTLVFAGIQGRWKRLGTVWVILAMLFVGGGLWALFLATLENSYQPIQSPLMFFPLPLFLFVMLYWVRWWAMRPPAAWVDEIAEARSGWRG